MKNLKHLLLLALCIVMTSQLTAQNSKIGQLPLSVSYYGENAIHPGFKLGTYTTLWSAEKSKARRFKGLQTKFGDRRKLRELNLDFNLGLYSHPNNHTGLFVNTGVTFLRTKLRKNRQLGISFEIGYLRRAYKFTTYELYEDGTSGTIPGAGNNSLVIGLAPQFGKEFMIKQNPVRIYCKPVFQILKYAHTWLPNVNLEIGTVININRK